MLTKIDECDTANDFTRRVAKARKEAGILDSSTMDIVRATCIGGVAKRGFTVIIKFFIA